MTKFFFIFAFTLAMFPATVLAAQTGGGYTIDGQVNAVGGVVSGNGFSAEAGGNPSAQIVSGNGYTSAGTAAAIIFLPLSQTTGGSGGGQNFSNGSSLSGCTMSTTAGKFYCPGDPTVGQAASTSSVLGEAGGYFPLPSYTAAPEGRSSPSLRVPVTNSPLPKFLTGLKFINSGSVSYHALAQLVAPQPNPSQKFLPATVAISSVTPDSPGDNGVPKFPSLSNNSKPFVLYVFRLFASIVKPFFWFLAI